MSASDMPFIGGFFGPSSADKAKQTAFGTVGDTYMGMRPEMAQGYQNLLAQMQAQMAPAHQALANMYGGGAMGLATPQQDADAASSAWSAERAKMTPPENPFGSPVVQIPMYGAVDKGQFDSWKAADAADPNTFLGLRRSEVEGLQAGKSLQQILAERNAHPNPFPMPR